MACDPPPRSHPFPLCLPTDAAAYHLAKFVEFRNYEMSRIAEAEKLLHDYEMRRGAHLGVPPPQRGTPHRDDYQPPVLPTWSSGARPSRSLRPELERRTPSPPGGF